MSYGIEAFRANGDPVASSDFSGGVYCGFAEADPGDSAIVSVPGVAVGGLLGLQTLAGGHTWAIGSSGGVPRIVFTPAGTLSRPNTSQRATRVHLWAKQPTPDGYGFLVDNGVDGRQLSTRFPVPVFIGRYTLNPTFLTANLGDNGQTAYSYETTLNLGASTRNRIVLWNLPSTGNSAWFAGTCSAAAGAVVKARAVSVRPTGDGAVLPDAWVFAVDGHPAGAEPWGLRLFNAAGAIMFDSGLNHLRNPKIVTLDYPPTGSATTTIYSQTVPEAAGALPLFMTAGPGYASWTSTGASSSTGREHRGCMRRSGTTVYTRSPKIATMFEDINWSESYPYGVNTDVPHLILNGNDYT